MRLTPVMTAVFSFAMASQALAASTWVCDLGPGDAGGLSTLEMQFVTGHVAGSPLASEKIEFFRVARDRSGARTFLGSVSADSIVGYWNSEKSLRIRAVDTLPGATSEEDVLYLEASAQKLSASEKDDGVEVAYKLESPAYLRLVDPRNPRTVTRNQRKQGTRITCTRG